MKPKRWTSYKVCPNCGGRATKLFNISEADRPVECLQCGHRYDPPEYAKKLERVP